MKIAGVCLLALAFIGANSLSGSSRHLPTPTVGKTYLSDYKAYTVTGFPLLSNERTGVAIWTKVLVHLESETRLVAKLQDPTIRQVHLDIDSVLPVDRVPDLEEALSKPEEFQRLPKNVEDLLKEHILKEVVLKFENGKITEVVVDKNEPEWILSLKTGIFQYFQVPTVTKTTETMVEDTFVGRECEVFYDIARPNTTSDTIWVTKQFSLDNCKKPLIHDDLLRIANEPRKDIEKPKNLRSSFVTMLNMTAEGKPFIFEMVAEGRYTMTMFTPNHGEAITYTRQEMKYMGTVDTKLVKTARHPVVRRTSITPEMLSDKIHMYMTEPEAIKLDLIKTLFTEIVQETVLSSEPTFEGRLTEKFNLAVQLMSTLTETSSIKQIVDLATQEQNKPMRNLVITALSNTQTTVVAKALTTLGTKLTKTEITEIIYGLAINGVPTTDLIHELKKVYVAFPEEHVREQTLLAIGSQLYELCRPMRVYGKDLVIPKDTKCTKDFKNEFINFFKKEYVNGDETRKLIVLKAIGNSGLDLVEFMSAIIRDTTMPMELRVNAIRAFRRVSDVRTVMDTLLPVFRLQSHPVELRIEAFNVLLEIEPTEEMLTVLVSHFNMEDNLQLGNYVYTYLESIIDIPTIFAPTKDLTIGAQNLLPTLKRFESNWWYSMNIQTFVEQLGLKVFRHLETRMLVTDEQTWPRSFMLKLTREYCGFFVNTMEAGLRFEGADTFLQELYTKYYATTELFDSYSTVYARSFMRDISKIHQILSNDQIVSRPIEKPRGHFFWRVLGAELGVIRFNEKTLEQLPTDMLNTLMKLDENMKYFNIFSQAPLTLRAPTMMGTLIFHDYTNDVVTSLNIEDSDVQKDDLIWSKHITLRNLMKKRSMHGVALGPLEVAIGSCQHVKVILPHTIEVTMDSKSEKVGIELYWNVKDPVYKSMAPENYDLITIEQTPINYFLNIDTTKRQSVIMFEKMNMHPLLKVSEERYYFDFVGHNFTSIQHIDEHTMALPAFPYDGRHLISLSFYDRVVKPFGIKMEFNLKSLVSSYTNGKFDYYLDITLNPRVPEETKALSLGLSYSEERFAKQTPVTHITLEYTPQWENKGTYRVFFQKQELMGRSDPELETLSWYDAAEDRELEKLFTLQYGWNMEYTKEKQDIVLRYKVSKSDLQKLFEREDLKLEDSECYKCEKLTQETGVHTNIHCETCMLKRQSRTQKDYAVFINKEKYGSDLLVKIFEFLDRGNVKYLSDIQSRYQENVTPKLVQEFRTLVNEYMTELNNMDQLLAFRRVEDVHPFYTMRNITTEVEDEHLRYLRVPLTPAERRLDNLPLDRLTDVHLQRFDYQTQGICQLDSLNTVKTMDEVVYKISDFPTNCERVLARDCSDNKTFEITVSKPYSSSPKVVLVKVAERVIKIVPQKTSVMVTVDNTPLLMNRIVRNEFVYETFETKSISGIVSDIVTPNKDTIKSVEVFLGDILTQIVVIEDYVKIMVPFWYKNKICGLCGDFNTERVDEFKLPNEKVADSLTSFINAYSSDKCYTRM